MKILRVEDGKDKVIKSDIKSVTLILTNGMRIRIDDECKLYGGIEVSLERQGGIVVLPRMSNVIQIRENKNG